MHATGKGWCLAGFADSLPVPGWPPKL